MRKVIFICFYVSLVIMSGLVTAINNDSLLTVWNDPAKADTSRIKAYQNYIWNVYLFSNPDTSLILTQALKDFSNKKNSAYGKRQVEFLKGSIYYVKGDFPNSLLYYKNTLKWDEQLNDKGALSTTLINIGLISHEHKKDDEALTYFLKALKILEEVGDKKGNDWLPYKYRHRILRV
jgi:tetratricopeptide (TPR) repeat protein